MLVKDTIVALSTPPGRSGIGVVRLSGTHALQVLRVLTKDEHLTPEPNRVVLKKLYAQNSTDVLDRALVTFFKAPHSFTGEDVVELSCHGSPVLLRQIIDFTLHLDARLAEPGEFALRALANGRLNLSQAEAIRDLIDARTDAAARQSMRQLGGELSARLQSFKNTLLEIIVPLESALEFVEDDLPPHVASQLSGTLRQLISEIEALAETFRAGHVLREGLKVTFAGRPNVGKSSLFNSLLKYERAIVSSIPGTTRDSLTEELNVQGIPFTLTDTAGLRSSTDEIENLGVIRSRRAMADADIVVVVLDSSQPITHEDQEIIESITGVPHVVALNKSDLKAVVDDQSNKVCCDKCTVISVSAKSGEGVDVLRNSLVKPFMTLEASGTGLLITNARHYDLLQRAAHSLRSASNLYDKRASEELILAGLHTALQLLGQITGETTPDDVLDRIFATFCIGK